MRKKGKTDAARRYQLCANSKLWPEFLAYIENAKHFGALSLDVDWEPTAKNFNEWNGMWHAFRDGVGVGQLQVADAIKRGWIDKLPVRR